MKSYLKFHLTLNLSGDILSQLFLLINFKKVQQTYQKSTPKDVDETELISEVESFKFQAESLMDNLKNANPIDLSQMLFERCLPKH